MTVARLTAALAEPGPRLDQIALAIAALDDEPGDEAEALATLDGWGARVAASAGGSVYAGMDALERLLVGELGLEGDRDDYDHPRNSFLPQVLARRRGLPILLSIVYLEVARRAGLPLVGLALPGHFVVGYRLGPGQLVVIDPFERARILTRPDLDAIARRAGVPITPAMLAPAATTEITARVLRNLGGSYQRRGDVAKLAAVVAMLRASRAPPTPPPTTEPPGLPAPPPPPPQAPSPAPARDLRPSLLI
ncbi:MAG: transglutaminase family protein [Myxococcales bacterium]|nr:transglutaminase family protein [Myxococcales bacterium]